MRKSTIIVHSNARSLRCRGNLKSMMWIAFKIHCTTQWCIVTKILSSSNSIIAITYNNYKLHKTFYQNTNWILCQLPCLKCLISYDETCIIVYVLDKFSLDENGQSAFLCSMSLALCLLACWRLHRNVKRSGLAHTQATLFPLLSYFFLASKLNLLVFIA